MGGGTKLDGESSRALLRRWCGMSHTGLGTHTGGCCRVGGGGSVSSSAMTRPSDSGVVQYMPSPARRMLRFMSRRFAGTTGEALEMLGKMAQQAQHKKRFISLDKFPI